VPGQEQLDTRAIELANRALDKVEQHILECTETNRKFSRQQESLFILVRESRDELGKIIRNVSGTIILGLIGLVAFLLVKQLGW